MAQPQEKAGIQFLAQKFANSDITRKACEAECQKYITSDKEELICLRRVFSLKV